MRLKLCSIYIEEKLNEQPLHTDLSPLMRQIYSTLKNVGFYRVFKFKLLFLTCKVYMVKT